MRHFGLVIMFGLLVYFFAPQFLYAHESLMISLPSSGVKLSASHLSIYRIKAVIPPPYCWLCEVLFMDRGGQ
jgi:hypothetical protein